MNIKNLLISILLDSVILIKAEDEELLQIPFVFDSKTAEELYSFTKIAVCNTQLIESWDCGYFCSLHPNVSEVKVFENKTHSSLGYIGFEQQKNRIIVTFRRFIIRGSQNVRNLLNDMKFVKIDYKCERCAVHRGFLETYEDVQEPMIRYIQELYEKHQKPELYILGHSLGAAMAAFASIDLELNGINVNTFIIYGSPRIGNTAFKEYFQKVVKTPRKVRITNHQDIVPHLPPMRLDYHHIVKEIWFKKNFDSYIECDSTCEDPTCSNSSWTTSLRDHQTYFKINYKCGDLKYKKITRESLLQKNENTN